MRHILICFCLLGTIAHAQKPRLAILTDIGGDPDDRQSMIRLMLYANEFDIQLLLASAAGTPGELKEKVTRPELIDEIIETYSSVLPHLKQHASGWPEAIHLHSCVKSGNPHRGRSSIGPSGDTDGSRALVRLVDEGTEGNPLNIAIWGGQTDLAQALWRVKTDRGVKGLSAFATKARIYDIADQDGLASWIRQEFPGLFYILAKSPKGMDRREAVFRGMYLTGDEALTSAEWIETNIKKHGPLGALYPMKTFTAPNPHGCMKEGDTPSWFFFLPLGGNNPADPSKPGWGGQFERQADGWWLDPPKAPNFDPRTSVSRWRPAFQADFARRMSWCVK
ncbi:MAG: DUF1593 domain-containing protein [Verrucomicrobiaceae bacterium]|nr:DUF1593 domain-containing protein [Verrucomicrobiaceae bacterium]